MRASKRAAIAADRDRWTKKAFDDCVVAAKDLIGNEGPIRSDVHVGRLVAAEWGWLVSTIVWTWIATRSEQAATEGWDYERAAHTSALNPDPWTVGAVASVLPKLVAACPELDWSKSLGEWPKDDIVAFLLAGFTLTQHAFAARDAAENPPGSGGVNADVVARKINAAAGGPLMTAAELNDLALLEKFT
jgi:hypothetical protein